MPDLPRFLYFISSPAVRVLPDSDDWRQPLPMARDQDARLAAGAFCHGDYFRAVRSFFEQDGLEMVSRHLGRRLGKPLDPHDINEIRICLEKHGQFYHPARIDAVAGESTASFVLNVAVSETGLQTISGEYRRLKKLNDEFEPSFVPRVYGLGEVSGAGSRSIAMFLGQWFDGYHEFHLARDGRDETLKLQVWDRVNGLFFLTPDQTVGFYRLAARILTGYYNLKTFEQVCLWHHAAGDFVIRIDPSGLDVKLVTARRYAPLFNDPGLPADENRDAGLIVQALLVFLLNLSLRMRLDRLAGVGDMVWAPDVAVESTLAGFFEALALKPRLSCLPDSPDRCLRYYLSTCTREDLLDLCQSLADTFNLQTAEAAVVKRHLPEHVEALSRAVVSTTT